MTTIDYNSGKVNLPPSSVEVEIEKQVENWHKQYVENEHGYQGHVIPLFNSSMVDMEDFLRQALKEIARATERKFQHWSDCARHNEPAEPAGECNCGGYSKEAYSRGVHDTLEKIKDVYWETFHESGEQWFNYLGTPEENQKSTQHNWEDFEDSLKSSLKAKAGEE